MFFAFDVVCLEQLHANLGKFLTVERLLFGNLALSYTAVYLVCHILYLYNEGECDILARELLFIALAPETVVQIVVLDSTQLLYETETAVVVCDYKAVRRYYFTGTSSAKNAYGILD